MFPQWDDDGEDTRVENIIKAMYGQLTSSPWKWLPIHWGTQGVLSSNNKPMIKDDPSRGVKREVEFVDDGAHKKARLDNSSVKDLEKRLADALVAAVDERLLQFEGVVKEHFINTEMKLTYLTTKVEEIASRQGEHTVQEPKRSDGKEEKPGAVDNQGEVDAKSTAAGVSIPPLEKMDSDVERNGNQAGSSLAGDAGKIRKSSRLQGKKNH